MSSSGTTLGEGFPGPPPGDHLAPGQAGGTERLAVHEAELLVLHHQDVVVDGVAEHELRLWPVRGEDQILHGAGHAAADRAGGEDRCAADAVHFYDLVAVVSQRLVEEGMEALDLGGVGAHRRVQHLGQEPQESFVAVGQAEPFVDPDPVLFPRPVLRVVDAVLPDVLGGRGEPGVVAGQVVEVVQTAQEPHLVERPAPPPACKAIAKPAARDVGDAARTVSALPKMGVVPIQLAQDGSEHAVDVAPARVVAVAHPPGLSSSA
jgi:hypothetical protein